MNHYELLLIPVIIFVAYILFSITYVIIIKIINNNVTNKESLLIAALKKRATMIPSLYDTTKEYLNKHDEVFKNLMKFSKISFYTNNATKMIEIFKSEDEIRHEFSFVFAVTNKHPKINTDSNFVYVRDIIIGNNEAIKHRINNYKKSARILNTILKLKFTIFFGTYTMFTNITEKEV